MRTGCRAEVRWLSCFSPSGAVGSCPGAPFALAGGHRQSGRSVGEKAGEQASWPAAGFSTTRRRTAPGSRRWSPSSDLADPGAFSCRASAPATTSGGPAGPETFSRLSLRPLPTRAERAPGPSFRGQHGPAAPVRRRCSCGACDLGRATRRPAGGGRAPGWVGNPLRSPCRRRLLPAPRAEEL